MAMSSRADSISNLHYIPAEILIQIFVKLPVKSLLRFKPVCKQWCSIITDPTFIQAHLQTSSQNSYIILRYESQLPKIDCYSIRYDDQSFREYFEAELPSHLKQSLGMFGSCNGLICLSDRRTVCLWNPALRKIKTLPKSLIVDSGSDQGRTTYVAFGFHPGVNDYNVVRILCLGHEMDKPYENQFLTEVYSLRTDTWRRIGVAPSCYIFDRKPAILNGASYWVAIDRNLCCFLVRFEMGGEVFEEVKLPNGAPHCCPYIAVFGESLYLFRFYGENQYCDIWTTEYGEMGCWTKRFTVTFRDAHVKLLCFRKSGEYLHVNRKNNMLSYNLESQRAKDLGIHAFLWTLSAYSYVESLIQLDGAKSTSFST